MKAGVYAIANKLEVHSTLYMPLTLFLDYKFVGDPFEDCFV